MVTLVLGWGEGSVTSRSWYWGEGQCARVWKSFLQAWEFVQVKEQSQLSKKNGVRKQDKDQPQAVG